MQPTKIVPGILVIILAACTSCKKQTDKTTKQEYPTANQGNPSEVKNPGYDKLRQSAFDASPEQLGLSNLKPDEIYGVIIDYGSRELIMTFVAYKNGDASSYWDVGAVLKGNGNDDIVKAAKHFVESAESYISSAKKTDIMLSQDTTSVKFYFLTPGGKYYARESTINIINNTSQWVNFLKEGMKISTALISSN